MKGNNAWIIVFIVIMIMVTFFVVVYSESQRTKQESEYQNFGKKIELAVCEYNFTLKCKDCIPMEGNLAIGVPGKWYSDFTFVGIQPDQVVGSIFKTIRRNEEIQKMCHIYIFNTASINKNVCNEIIVSMNNYWNNNKVDDYRKRLTMEINQTIEFGTEGCGGILTRLS